jgi:LacI family transcriptional regulator
MATTINDIARETGYHPTTVSQVLNKDKRCFASAKTKLLITETAQRLHYVPNYFARGLKGRRSFTVGIVGHPGTLGVTGVQLDAITITLLSKGYMPLYCGASFEPDGTERAIRELKARLVDGIILESGDEEERLETMLPKDGIPAVVIRHAASTKVPCIIPDRFMAFQNGVRWLAERAHRRIALMGVDYGKVMQSPVNSDRIKCEGYRAGMESLGLSAEALVLDAAGTAGAVREYVEQHGEQFRALTAVFATSDQIAIEVMTGLASLGLRVPEDCSVMGFDDTSFAVAVKPRLTTFRPRRKELGTRAAEMMLELIENRPVENVTIVPELVERESTGLCRRS